MTLLSLLCFFPLFFISSIHGVADHKHSAECHLWQTSDTTNILSRLVSGTTTGTKRLLFYRVRFTDTPNAPVSIDDAETALQTANAIFQRMSYRRFSLEWVITPVLELPHDSEWYRRAGFNDLVAHSRAAALAAGLNYESFDLDLIQHHPLPGFPAGQANLGSRGAIVQDTRPALYVHELGHNLGLPHANGWNNERPPLNPRVSPPFPSDVANYGEPFDFDPAALIGKGDIITPGRTSEAEDPFDLMGAGEGDFNAAFKARLGWLSGSNVVTVATNGIYRLYAFDQGSLRGERSYALRLQPLIAGRNNNGFIYRYWLGYRANRPANGAATEGIDLHWIDQGERYSSAQLDSNPGSSRLRWDAPLPLGRTFTDQAAGIHITAIAAGNEDRDVWVDVAVQVTPSTTNRPPVLAPIAAATNRIDVGVTLLFNAPSTDPDGDSVAYFWDFGDGTIAGNIDETTKSWINSGHYVVTCEASDGKGGIDWRHFVVQVGEPSTWQISGQIRDAQGKPVAGAIVHNGRVTAEFGYLNDYVMTKTDAEGRYTLTNLRNGSYPVRASAYGFVIRAANENASVIVNGANVAGADFLATELPLMAVRAVPETVHEGEPVEFIFERSGPTATPMAVRFVAYGSAAEGQDYVPFTTNLITIPAGSATARLTVTTLDDLDEELPKTLVIAALPPIISSREVVREAQINTINFFFPGWEPHPENGITVWHQTEPEFRINGSSSAAVTILDDTPPGLQRVSIFADGKVALESPLTSSHFRAVRNGNTARPLDVHYTLAGSAEMHLDYEPLPGVVTIPAGQDFAMINVTPIPDGIWEDPETVEISLKDHPSYFIENGQATLIIQEDEYNSGPNELSFASQWDGSIVVSMKGQHGCSYVLQSSIDLKNWTNLSTNEVFFSPISIRMPPLSEDQRYYRTYLVPTNPGR